VSDQKKEQIRAAEIVQLHAFNQKNLILFRETTIHNNQKSKQEIDQ